MAFTVKNISENTITIFAEGLYPRDVLDVSTVADGYTIVSSLTNGQLYKYLQGKAIAVVDVDDFNDLPATQSDLDFFASCGFFSDLGKIDPKNPPALTTVDGYSIVSVSNLDEIEVTLGSIDTSLNNIEASVDVIETTVGSIDTSLNNIEASVDIIESNIVSVIADGYMRVDPVVDNSTPVTVRTLSSQVAETSTPAAGSFVSLSKTASFVEFDFASLAFGGTVICDYMIVKFWRATTGDTVGSYIDQLIVYPNQVANINRKVVVVNAQKVYATVNFVGGTAPTVSGTITARLIDVAGINKSDFSFDAKNNLKTVDETYDISADANRSYLVVDHTDKWNSEKPAEITGTGLVTFNADIDMRGYNKLGIQIIGTSGTASSIKFAIQTTKDTNVSPQFVTVTGAVKNATAADALLVPDGSGDIAIPTSSTSYDLNMSNVNALFVRIRWTVSAHANNVLYCDVYKSV